MNLHTFHRLPRNAAADEDLFSTYLPSAVNVLDPAHPDNDLSDRYGLQLNRALETGTDIFTQAGLDVCRIVASDTDVPAGRRFVTEWYCALGESMLYPFWLIVRAQDAVSSYAVVAGLEAIGKNLLGQDIKIIDPVVEAVDLGYLNKVTDVDVIPSGDRNNVIVPASISPGIVYPRLCEYMESLLMAAYATQVSLYLPHVSNPGSARPPASASVSAVARTLFQKQLHTGRLPVRDVGVGMAYDLIGVFSNIHPIDFKEGALVLENPTEFADFCELTLTVPLTDWVVTGYLEEESVAHAQFTMRTDRYAAAGLIDTSNQFNAASASYDLAAAAMRAFCSVGISVRQDGGIIDRFTIASLYSGEILISFFIGTSDMPFITVYLDLSQMFLRCQSLIVKM